eukprot:Em0004g262a
MALLQLNLSQSTSNLKRSLEDAYSRVREHLGTTVERQKEVYDLKVHGKAFEIGDLSHRQNRYLITVRVHQSLLEGKYREPGVALARSSGQRGPKRLSTGSEQREAAKRARIEIAKATDLEERTIGTEPTIKQVETVHDLWQAFGWSQATKKKLPNEDLRKGDVLLKESGDSGWSTMVQSFLAAVVRCAEILYPANSDSLLEEVAARLSQSSSSITTKDENRVTENTIMIMNASQKRSIQARVARAILVKGLPGHRIQSLKRDGVFTLGGSSVDQARKDFKVMEAGMSLCIPPITRCRFDEQILHEAVMFILSKDNVTPISWGTKQIKLSDAETVTLPCLTRRNSPRHMYENYMALCSERGTNSAAGDSHLSISRGKFYEILRNITAGGEKILGFAYSGIGDGVTFRTSLKTGLFRPCSCNASVNDLEADSKDDDDESTDIDGEELSVDANEVADYIFHVEGDDNKVEDQDEGEENDEDEIYSEDEDNEIAPAGFSGYGWARRPQRGAQYGRAYLEPYKKDIKRMFERGACVSSDKMSPCAMLEELQSLYPGRYTLPGENEIRAEITKLFGRKKASDEDNAGSDHDESENEATKGRGSNLPKQYVKHLEDLVERNPTIRPAEALRNLKAALCLPHPFEHDKAIK